MLGFLTFFTNLPISAGDKPILVDPQDVLNAANWLVLDQALDVAPCNEILFSWEKDDGDDDDDDDENWWSTTLLDLSCESGSNGWFYQWF